MNLLKSNEVAINLKLFKLLRFYHLLNPSSRKVFNINFYRLTIIFFTIIFVFFTIYGQFGWFIKMDDHIDDITILMSIFHDTMSLTIVLKIILFVYNADEIWDIFIMTRVHLLKSNKCQKNVHMLQKYGKLSIRITQTISIALIGTVFIWGALPFVLNLIFAHKTNQRMENILNHRFPVTIYTYNNYFILFYIIELALLSFALIIFLANDFFIISFGFNIMAQYEIITMAFEDIGYEEQTAQNSDGNLYSKFIVNSIELLKD